MIRYIIIFLGIILLFSSIFAIKNEKLSIKSKIISVLSLILLIILGYLYEKNVYNNVSIREKILQEFKQGKDIKCAEFYINKANFNYEFGTQSFLPKNHFESNLTTAISIDKCESKNEK